MASVRTARSARIASFDFFQPIWRLLTSVRFAVFYIAALALVGLMGVLIPQVPEPMRGNTAAINIWLDTQRGTFGPLTDPMHRLGLFEVFHAKWFLFALGFLVVNVSVCTFNRWSPTFRNVFHPNKRVPETFYERAHNRTQLAPVDAGELQSALRGLRFKVSAEERNGKTYLFADRYPWTQLATFVSHMALILFIAGGLVTALTRFSTEIFAGDGTTAPVFAVTNPNQLQVRIDDAVGRFGAGGNALDYRTHLTIFRNGEEVASGTTTVNDPFEYGGYRFHQIAYFPYGSELRVRDLATGNTVMHETFPLEDTIAAPVVTIRDGSGRVLLSETVPPTDFLQAGSGSLVAVPGADRSIWVGLTPEGDQDWRLVAFDPSAPGGGQGDQVGVGQSATVGGLDVRFDRVESLPAAVGVDVPGSDSLVLAQMTGADSGDPRLTLVSDNRPALSLAPGEPVVAGDYEYMFEGQRDFAGIGVRRDMGQWFIWVATAMLVGGLAITFYLPRRRLWIRLSREGTDVAALAEKSGGFEKDMRTLARRLRLPVPKELQEEA